MPETSAKLRYHRASPSKVRQVLRLIVGQDVNEAREILRFCERGASDPVMKLLDSAVANAEHNDNVPEDELFVARAFADEGPTLKRGRPRARGRYGRIKKRTSHITITVARFEDDVLERRREREAATAAPTRVSRRRRVAESRRRARAQAAHDHDHEHDDEELEDDDALDAAVAEPEAGESADVEAEEHLEAEEHVDVEADEDGVEPEAAADADVDAAEESAGTADDASNETAAEDESSPAPGERSKHEDGA
jgi:large subunit ribosomal protein L22